MFRDSKGDHHIAVWHTRHAQKHLRPVLGKRTRFCALRYRVLSKQLPHPELYKTFLNDRHAFVKWLRQQHERTVLDWGFPVRCLSWVDELRTCGVRLIWFSGDIAHAREEFKKRGDGKGPEDNFNKQVTAIQKEGYPASLDCVIVPALSSSGVFLDQHQIENIVFPPITSAHI